MSEKLPPITPFSAAFLSFSTLQKGHDFEKVFHANQSSEHFMIYSFIKKPFNAHIHCLSIKKLMSFKVGKLISTVVESFIAELRENNNKSESKQAIVIYVFNVIIYL